jgi:hypothetical protein
MAQSAEDRFRFGVLIEWIGRRRGVQLFWTGNLLSKTLMSPMFIVISPVRFKRVLKLSFGKK